jgi:serine protease Do
MAAAILGVVFGGHRSADATRDPAERDLDVAMAVSRSHARTVAAVHKGVVAIDCYRGPRVDAAGKKSAGTEGYGAGLVVRADGRILTALHVVANSIRIQVRLHDGRSIPAKVIARDEGTDLALLALEAEGLDLLVPRMGDDQATEIGESVIAIGNPFGMADSASRGILSGRGRTNVVENNTAALLQTDAAINPGSSGGPLFNLRGEVIGLVNAILTRSGGHQGLAFAVPSRELAFSVPRLMRGEKVSRGWLGIQVRGNQTKSGIDVVTVVPGGPASEGGLRSGDRIVRWESRSIEELTDLRPLIRTAAPGGRVAVEVMRSGKRQEFEILVGTR